MNIIAIDDERSALNVLIKSIKDAVPIAKIHGFCNSFDALKLMKEIKCDIAFLDIQMNQIDGITLAKRLKEIYPQINIVFVTAYSKYTDEAFSIHASGYIYKPATKDKIILEMENLRHQIKWKKTGIFVKTFGEFEVFANDKKVHFNRNKSKEMLAYLIDKKGIAVTRKELAKILFETEEYSRTTQNYLSKIIKELERVLKEIGASKILKKGFNSYSIDVYEIECDLYNYEKEDPEPEDINRFKGEYMNQYSWAEVTLGRLYWKRI